MKPIIAVVIALIFFISCGIFIAGRNTMPEWVGTLFIFTIGYQWVHTYAFNKNMYTLYIAETLYANDIKYKNYRVLHLILGIVLCIFSSVF